MLTGLTAKSYGAFSRTKYWHESRFALQGETAGRLYLRRPAVCAGNSTRFIGLGWDDVRFRDSSPENAQAEITL
jgi:hypothetical protein